MSDSSPVTVILNERHARAWRRRGHDLSKTAEVVVTAGETDGTDAARRAARSGAAMVVAAGGDGTIQSVAAGLMRHGADKEARPVLGVCPLGHGNDLARALAERPVEAMDVGRIAVDDRDLLPGIFLNSLGIGLEGRVASATFFGYTGGALRTILFGRRRWHLEGTLEGEPFGEDVSVLSIGNGHSTGGGFRLTPDARLDDGALDYCAASVFARMRLVGLMRKARRGTHLGAPGVRGGRLRTLALRADPAVPLHADGEPILEAREIRVEVLPAALRVRLLD